MLFKDDPFPSLDKGLVKLADEMSGLMHDAFSSVPKLEVTSSSLTSAWYSQINCKVADSKALNHIPYAIILGKPALVDASVDLEENTECSFISSELYSEWDTAIDLSWELQADEVSLMCQCVKPSKENAAAHGLSGCLDARLQY